MTVDEVRELFPQLAREVYPGKPLVYFDNAATSQRPLSVLECYHQMASWSNGNVHRGIHRLSNEATEAMEAARQTAAEFLNADSAKEIIFTSGATAALNLVAHSFTRAFMRPGDEIILSRAEHHSNIVPWQIEAEAAGLVIKVLDVDEHGQISLSQLSDLISEHTKIVSIAHVSNVLGIVNPVEEIVSLCHERGCRVCIDGSQGILHSNVDVQALDCDFYIFSAHKLYAATGVGVLYGKKELLEQMPPFLAGGEMISEVSFEKTTFAPLPLKFEAGTPNFNAIATLTPAIKLVSLLRSDTYLIENERSVSSYIYDSLTSDSRIRVYGTPTDKTKKIPLFSFNVSGVHPADLATLLDHQGIAARSGELCAAPLMRHYGVDGMLRISLAPYNTIQEAETFLKALEKSIRMLA